MRPILEPQTQNRGPGDVLQHMEGITLFIMIFEALSHISSTRGLNIASRGLHTCMLSTLRGIRSEINLIFEAIMVGLQPWVGYLAH